MAIGTTELISGALGGAVVQSVLGPLILQRGERRDVRAQLLRRVGETEQLRWAPGGDWASFRTALAALRADALIASVPRRLVDQYVAITRVAWIASHQSWEEIPDEEHGGGGIDGDLADLARDAARLMVLYAWHPLRRRFLVGIDLRRLERKKITLNERGRRPRFDFHLPERTAI